MYQSYLNTITLTAVYQALSATSLIGTYTITASPANAGSVTIKGSNGVDTVIVAGEWHKLENIDLSTISVKGTANDLVTVIGETF